LANQVSSKGEPRSLIRCAITWQIAVEVVHDTTKAQCIYSAQTVVNLYLTYCWWHILWPVVRVRGPSMALILLLGFSSQHPARPTSASWIRAAWLLPCFSRVRGHLIWRFEMRRCSLGRGSSTPLQYHESARDAADTSLPAACRRHVTIRKIMSMTIEYGAQKMFAIITRKGSNSKFITRRGN
jgi:hypothetical protein